MYQRLPVISPLAPAAIRLLQFADESFSREQMFDVVSDVREYRHFIPWCRRSDIIENTWNATGIARRASKIGFPPLNE
ncbi:hypothetical protein OSTOST_09918 [Ostertagia ostertagi]